MAKVDVIIPFFNTPIEFVRIAIESVRAQTLRDWRAVVVNDGSAEAHTAALDALLAELADPRITGVKTSNQGPAAARNAGIRASNSPYIALLDSDDAWQPSKLAVQVEILESRPEIALIHARHDALQPDGVLAARKSKSYLNVMSQQELVTLMLRENFVAVGTALFRRGCVEQSGLFDDGFRYATVEDKEFWLRLLLDGHKFLYLDEALLIYRLHGANNSKNVERMMDARLRLIEKVDAAIVGMPQWKGIAWPAMRRQMLRHAFQEAAEGCLERRQFGQALRYSLLPRGGFDWRLGRVAVAAAYGMIAGKA